MNALILDIETFALDDAAEYIDEPTAPANYKDQEKIAAYVADAKAKAISKCALDVDLCRIVAIGYSGIAGTGVEVCGHENQERGLLAEMWIAATKLGQYDGFCGFNILAFDLPVLIRRSQYLGVDVPRMALNLDKYRTPHIDLMERLSFNGKVKYRSLDFYCRRFGISVPDDTSGKDIDALVRAGDWAAVEAHCRADIQKTRLLAERLGVLAGQEVA